MKPIINDELSLDHPPRGVRMERLMDDGAFDGRWYCNQCADVLWGIIRYAYSRLILEWSCLDVRLHCHFFNRRKFWMDYTRLVSQT